MIALQAKTAAEETARQAKAATEAAQEAKKEAKEAREAATAREIARDLANAVHRVAKLDKLQDPHKLYHFLTNFTQHMIRCAVPKHAWIRHFIPSLDDKSQHFHATMPTEMQEDFDEVRLQLLAHHGLGRTHFRQKWDQFEISKEGTLLQAWQELEEIQKGWERIEPNVREVRLRDKFIDALPRHEKAHVLQFNPSTGAEVVKLASKPTSPPRHGTRPKSKIPRLPTKTPTTGSSLE